MASLFIKTLAELNVQAARVLAREVEGEGRAAPPKETKEHVESAPKPIKNAISKEEAPAAPSKEGIRWAILAHRQAGGISVPQNKTEVGRWTGPDGWSWKRVEKAHNWEAAKEKSAQDGRWWVVLEGGKLWGWSPPNARPSLGEKSPETKELAETDPKPVKDAVSKDDAAAAEKPASPGANALVEAARKRAKKASPKEVEDKKE